MSAGRDAFLAAARRVDWPRALQRGFTLWRALRGERAEEISADHQAELARAQKFRRAFTGLAREALGCTRSQGCCDCQICREERTGR